MRPVIYYSAGCHFCRWVARSIVARTLPQFDIVPTRSDEGIKALANSHWHWNKWIGHWHYQTAYGYLYNDPELAITSLNHGYLRYPKWTLKYMFKLDRWVKAHRGLLSHVVPQGPAILKVDGKVSWLNSDATPIEGEE